MSSPSSPMKYGTDNTAEEIAQARALVTSRQFGSTSMIQQRLKFGYAKAVSIMDELERQGVVGPKDGAKVRDVLVAE